MDTKILVLIAVVLGVAVAVAGVILLRGGREEAPAPPPDLAASFTIRIENNSAEDAIVTSDGSTAPFLLAPGAWAVHTAAASLFSEGVSGCDTPLEVLAEDGDPGPLAEMVKVEFGVASSGVFNTPLGADAPGVLAPGGAYEFHVTAEPGMKLSFATMFVQSNDLFYAPDVVGIELFDSAGTPVSGDVTRLVFLRDAGTEVNQEPGLGSDQAPRQAGPDTGEDENGLVQLVNDAYTYPDVLDVIRVTLTPEG